MIVSISQPAYLPWLGFFKKIMYSDLFVFLDDVQFVRGFNRNLITVNRKTTMLTVPIKPHSKKNLNTVRISNNSNWNKKHAETIRQAYHKCRYYNEYADFIKIYDKKFELLIDINMEIIHYLMDKFHIKKKILFSSELDIKEVGSNKILAICKKLNADTYLSGIHGINYLKLNDFKKSNIKVEFQNFQHPIYRQLNETFIPNLSSIDLLFNEGKNSTSILENTKNF